MFCEQEILYKNTVDRLQVSSTVGVNNHWHLRFNIDHKISIVQCVQ